MKTNVSPHSLSIKLDNAFEYLSRIEDDEIKSHYSRYLCVLVSGYLEESIRLILKGYTSEKAHGNIANYFNVTTSNLTNLKTEKICNLLNMFSSIWKDSFLDILTEEEKDAIDSVVANRHHIAHGRDVGVSPARVISWQKNIKKVVMKFSKIVNT